MIDEKVLFVDDDPDILEAHRRRLRKVLTVETALGGEEGLKALGERGPFALVVSDYNMPHMNGIRFLARVKETAPDTVRLMLTGNADLQVATNAVNEGAIFRFLTKPCPPDVMGQALIAGLEQYRLVTAEKQLLDQTLNGAVGLLSDILSMVSPEAFGRSLALRTALPLVIEELGVPLNWTHRIVPMLSSIGFVAVPPEVVKKALGAGPLNRGEREILGRTSEVAERLLRRIPRLEEVAEIISHQNRNYDGRDSPNDSPSGKDLPIGSRILKVLNDLFDLESRGAPREVATEEMQARKGSYDPEVLQAVFRSVPSMLHGQPKESMTLTVSLSGLKPGDYLLTDIETLDSRHLLSRENLLTDVLYERLLNYARISGIKEPITVERQIQRDSSPS